MPTQQTTYNSRVTDEALEKKFRDTFKSQGGAELIDDLYASGVIVPVVDFTAAAEGSALRQDLQRAYDFSTTSLAKTSSGSQTLVNTPGFWLFNTSYTMNTGTGSATLFFIQIDDGLSQRTVYRSGTSSSTANTEIIDNFETVVFLRSGDSLTVGHSGTGVYSNTTARQIADVYGNLVNPLGYTSS